MSFDPVDDLKLCECGTHMCKITDVARWCPVCGRICFIEDNDFPGYFVRPNIAQGIELALKEEEKNGSRCPKIASRLWKEALARVCEH